MIPILFLYLVGILMFILGIEETDDRTRAVIYLGVGFFADYMGYILSYQDSDYLDAAYFPIVVGIVTLVYLIYTAWQLIPHKLTWNEQTDEDGE